MRTLIKLPDVVGDGLRFYPCYFFISFFRQLLKFSLCAGCKTHARTQLRKKSAYNYQLSQLITINLESPRVLDALLNNTHTHFGYLLPSYTSDEGLH